MPLGIATQICKVKCPYEPDIFVQTFLQSLARKKCNFRVSIVLRLIILLVNRVKTQKRKVSRHNFVGHSGKIITVDFRLVYLKSSALNGRIRAEDYDDALSR